MLRAACGGATLVCLALPSEVSGFRPNVSVCMVRSSGFNRVREPCTGLKPLLRTMAILSMS